MDKLDELEDFCPEMPTPGQRFKHKTNKRVFTVIGNSGNNVELMAATGGRFMITINQLNAMYVATNDRGEFAAGAKKGINK